MVQFLAPELVIMGERNFMRLKKSMGGGTNQSLGRVTEDGDDFHQMFGQKLNFAKNASLPERYIHTF